MAGTMKENVIWAKCECGAVLQGDKWTKSEGAVRKAKSMELPLKQCCGCKGKPNRFGGLLDFSVLGHPRFTL